MSTKGYKVVRREKPFKENGKLRVWILLEKDTNKDENAVSGQPSSATQALHEPVDKPKLTDKTIVAPPGPKAATAAQQSKPAVNTKQTATPDNSRPPTPANTTATASTKQSGPAAAATTTTTTTKKSSSPLTTKPAAPTSIRKPQTSALRPSTAGARKRPAINRPRPSPPATTTTTTTSTPSPRAPSSSVARKRRLEEEDDDDDAPAPASKKPARGTVVGREPYRDGSGRLVGGGRAGAADYRRREVPREWADLARTEAVALAEHGGKVKTPYSSPFGKR